MSRHRYQTVQAVPVPEASARIDTKSQTRRKDRVTAAAEDMDEPEASTDAPDLTSLQKLEMFANASGDISDLLEDGQLQQLGVDAIRLWRIDQGSRAKWVETAKRALDIAAQEVDDEEYGRDGPWEDSCDINYPLLTTASQQFAARAGPTLVKGDKVVGVKAFHPRSTHAPILQAAKALPQPQSPADGQAQADAVQQQDQQDQALDLQNKQRDMRGERVSAYMNWLIFYKMDDWHGETDQLLHEIPVTGMGFKKVYFGTTGLCSEYVSALRLTVNNATKSLHRCPRVTQDFEIYPHEIENGIRAGLYRNVPLDHTSMDPEQPRDWIEQHTLADLDGDGLAEPYIVTVDVQSQQVMAVNAAYGADDIFVNEETQTVVRIDRWRAFAPFPFIPDARGRFYNTGFGKLLDQIMDSVDATMNQLIDAGTAQIAGGGFIGSGVRLQGSGQGGAVYWRPGEFQTVSTSGVELRNAIWERTVPQPSAVSYQLLELLLAAAKDITSVKDVITGDTPATAPVGTTVALQDQALQVFSAIYQRIYRGFTDEFRLMFHCLRRWATDREKLEYKELTGGDFDEDFKGDGTDIQPVADPAVITKMQKIARIQTTIQFAESPLGGAAGMQQPGPAQELAMEVMDTLGWDRPERFIATVPPNPLAIAKAADMQATAQLKTAQAGKQGAAAGLDHAKSLREIGLAAKDTHDMHVTADQIAQIGSLQPPPEGTVNGEAPSQAPNTAA